MNDAAVQITCRCGNPINNVLGYLPECATFTCGHCYSSEARETPQPKSAGEQFRVCAICGGDPQPIEAFSKYTGDSPRRRNDCKRCVAASSRARPRAKRGNEETK